MSATSTLSRTESTQSTPLAATLPSMGRLGSLTAEGPLGAAGEKQAGARPQPGADPLGELQVRIGEKIRKIRVDRHLTQKAFADQIAVNVSYIGPLEKGIKTPSIHTLERIASAFSLPVSYFFLDDTDPAESESSTLYKLRALLSSRNEEERAFLYKTLVELTKVLPEPIGHG